MDSVKCRCKYANFPRTQEEKMKKLFVLVFVIALSLCALTIGASAASSAPAGGGTADNPYRIGTAEELKWFAGLVNGTLTDDTQQNSAPALC